jgi:hypothetical protein
MAKTRSVGIAMVALATVCATLARAEDISTKKLFIKDHKTDPAKRQVQVQSKDGGVQFSEAGDPGTHGASLHVYSATDDFCVTLPSGAEWKNKDGNLLVKIKSGVTYTLVDNGTQGTVNAQVQFGTGTRYCMRCMGNKKDEALKFLGKDCAAAPCDSEPSICDPLATTTTTTPASTTTLQSGGTVLKGALTGTPGRFNFNLTLGLPGANSACNTNFAGTHACTYAELQSAAAAGDLVGLKDTGHTTVTSFWAIDSSQPALQQCNDDALGGSGLNWEYGTAHTASRGQTVALNNAAGTLGALQSGVQCNIAGTNWVGCCQ